MPIVGMVFPPLLHILVHFLDSEDDESGRSQLTIFIDVALIIIGMSISINTIYYAATCFKNSDNHFNDVHIKEGLEV